MRKRKMVLLRIGADSGSGGIQSPLYADGTFELVCIPDGSTGGDRTYGKLKDRAGRPLTCYIGEKYKDRVVHLDPEFETMTYGDPTRPKSGLRELVSGDYLVFTCGLQPWDERSGWDNTKPPSIYLAGYFVVQMAGIAAELGEDVVRSTFAQNEHVRDPECYAQQRDRLVLVKGGPGSRLLRKATRISEIGNDASGKPLKVLSGSMREHFGALGGKGSVQRSNPRWVSDNFVDKAVKFLETLE